MICVLLQSLYSLSDLGGDTLGKAREESVTFCPSSFELHVWRFHDWLRMEPKHPQSHLFEQHSKKALEAFAVIATKGKANARVYGAVCVGHE